MKDSDRSLVFVSHRNDLAQLLKQTYIGTVFSTDSELWEHAEEGDMISVRACVRFKGWRNTGYSAVLRFWKWIEPIVL